MPSIYLFQVLSLLLPEASGDVRGRGDMQKHAQLDCYTAGHVPDGPAGSRGAV